MSYDVDLGQLTYECSVETINELLSSYNNISHIFHNDEDPSKAAACLKSSLYIHVQLGRALQIATDF